MVWDKSRGIREGHVEQGGHEHLSLGCTYEQGSEGRHSKWAIAGGTNHKDRNCCGIFKEQWAQLLHWVEDLCWENEVGWGQIVKVLDYQPKRVGIYHTEMRSHWRLVRSWKPHFRRLLWWRWCAKEIRKDRMSHEKLENRKYQYVLGQTSPFSSICWLGLRGRHSSRGQMNNFSHAISPSPNSPRIIQPHSLEQAPLGESQVQLCAAPPLLFTRHI